MATRSAYLHFDCPFGVNYSRSREFTDCFERSVTIVSRPQEEHGFAIMKIFLTFVKYKISARKSDCQCICDPM